jgi:cell division protein FtsQ
MRRVVKKPLRASVRQNTMRRASDEEGGWLPRLSFGVRLALMLLAAIGLLIFVSWSWHNRWPQRMAARFNDSVLRATQQTGFSVGDVTLEGRRYTDPQAVLAALGVTKDGPIFAFDPQGAYDKIMALPWTESVSVIRSLPHGIIIRLVEREPIARWQHDDKTVVIDGKGRELTAAKPEQFANLPLVVGNAAPAQTQALLMMLADYPVVARVLKAAVRVGQRRWNFYLQPDILVRLPEHDPDAALARLTRLIQNDKVLDRPIAAIDLRFADREILEPGKKPAAPTYGDTSE